MLPTGCFREGHVKGIINFGFFQLTSQLELLDWPRAVISDPCINRTTHSEVILRARHTVQRLCISGA